MIKKYSDFLNENNSEKKFKTLPEGIEFLVTSCEKLATEDNYENGEIGNTQFSNISGIKGKSFSDINELAKKADLSADYDKWCVTEDRLSHSRMEDENGSEVESDSNLYKEFKAGEINLYSATYEFFVQIIEPKKIENKELADLLGAQLN